DVHLLAAAGRTARPPLAARPPAVRARFGKHHVAPRRLHGTGAVTVSAPRFHHRQPPAAFARAARLLPCDGDDVLAAPERLFEADGDRLVQIGAALRRALPGIGGALTEDVREQIAE